ncbi:MAG: hypothetical protein H7Z14_11870 [Anaerolineae bacterium]|nr:hypothetical protein [Phycisphaerae bacterium]
MTRINFCIAMFVFCGLAGAQTTQPASSAQPPSTQPSAGRLLDEMLKPSGTTARPLQPLPDPPAPDRTSGGAAVAPGSEQMPVIREGSFIVDRTGRLTKSPDGQQFEFNFEADGRTMKDPPVVIIPNLKLMAMENAVNGSNRDLKFRVTGMVTEYKGRNYVLLEKVVVVPDVMQKF